MILIPIGIMTNNKSILGFSFYVAPIGAIMALLCPEPAFFGFSLFVPRIFGYYMTHILILYSGIALSVLGIFKPKVKSIPTVSVTFVAISFLIHCVNLIMRATICSNANYFYTVSTSDVGILNVFWEIIPYPFWYLLPSLIILGFYMALVSAIFIIIDKYKKKG